MAVAVCCLAVAAFAVLVMLLRQRRITARLRSRVATLEGGQRLRDDELAHLVTTRLPVLVESLYGRPVDVPGPLQPRLNEFPYGRHLEKVTEMFGESAGRAKIRADESAKATLKSMMRGVQSLANEQQLAISRMQLRHDDPDVLEGLLKIDHMNAQLGRRAQVSAVLCGSWPGLQRSASPLTDVVRGGTSRIRDYLRVQLHSQVSDAVVSRAVEPVVLAVAELLDNAARHSQPNTPVEVNFQPGHNGMAIVIDDAGVAMNAEELKRAERLLGGQDEVDINRLGDPPQVGFAVIGVLAARYGFSVSVDSRSPYGGVRAVVFLPSALLTRADDRAKADRAKSERAKAERAKTERPKADRAETARPPAEPSTEPAEPAAASAGKKPPLTAGGLPRRRRVSAEAGQPQPAVRSEPATPPAASSSPASSSPAASNTEFDQQYPAAQAGEAGRSARQTAGDLGAWQRGTRSGRATVPTESEGKSQA
ncbi:sensor histidine kinase [Actinoallomurus bryophytorum]